MSGVVLRAPVALRLSGGDGDTVASVAPLVGVSAFAAGAGSAYSFIALTA